jgi:hypothetical protein
MEAIKSYRIPVDAPKDLIEEYFKAKQRAFAFVSSKIKFSNKAHLDFGSGERKELRNTLLSDWRFSRHYIDSAIDSVMDRDVVAVLNLQMRGAGFPQSALNELIEREGLSRSNETLST